MCVVNVENCNEGGCQCRQFVLLVAPVLLKLPYPFVYHGIDQDVKQLGGQGATLGDSAASPEGRAVITRRAAYQDGILTEATN